MPDPTSSPVPTRSSTSPADRRWMSLGPASRMLGVDPDTLRRWADEGRVRAWTTPGGHRRFDRTVLERLAADRRPGQRTAGLTDLGASPARLTRAYRKRYASDPPTGRASAAGEPGDAGEDLESYRQDGRRLITVLVAFLDAQPGDDAGRALAEAEAASIVDAQAERSVRGGLSLTESVATFVRARQPFLTEITGLGRRRSLDPARLGRLVEDASAVLDRLLLRFIEAHRAASERRSS